MYRHQQPSIFKLGGGGGFNRHNVVTFKTTTRDSASPLASPAMLNFTSTRFHVEQQSTLIDPFAFPTTTSIEPFTPKKAKIEVKTPKEQVNKKAAKEKEEEAEDDIFDFPPDMEQESMELKLMVASTRTIPENIKKTTTKKSKSTSKKKTLKSSPSTSSSTSSSSPEKKKKTPPTRNVVPLQQDKINTNNMILPTQQQQQDEFAFDYNPEIKIRHSSTTNDNNKAILSFTTNRPYNPNYQAPQSIISIANILNDPIAMANVNDFLNSNSISTPTPPPNNTQQEKKRKRNLVARLKSANGEKENKKEERETFDFFLSDDDDEQQEEQINNLLPIREIIQKERSASPELSYSERMELELASLMKSEIGDKKEEKQVTEQQSERRKYQPQNKFNVKFTFQKKK